MDSSMDSRRGGGSHMDTNRTSAAEKLPTRAIAKYNWKSYNNNSAVQSCMILMLS